MLLSKFYDIGVSESVGNEKNSVNVGRVDRMRVSEGNAEFRMPRDAMVILLPQTVVFFLPSFPSSSRNEEG